MAEENAHDSTLASSRLGDIFLRGGLLSNAQIEEIMSAQTARGVRFGDAAKQLGYLTQAQIDMALGEQFGSIGRVFLRGEASTQLVGFHKPFSTEAEEIRRLRSELILKLGTEAKIMLALVSPTHDVGKRYLALNLAFAFAQLGRATLLIDADLRDGALHHGLHLPSGVGLSTVLAGRTSAHDATLQITETLHFLPCGPRPPNPLELLRPPRLQAVLASMRETFDIVLLNTGTTASSSDAQIVAHQTGQALLIARQDASLLDELRNCRDDMLVAGVKILGTVLNYVPSENDVSQRARGWMRRLPWLRSI